MTVVSTGLWAFELDDAAGPPTQTFVTRRIRLADNRPVVHVCNRAGHYIGRLSGEVGAVAWRVDGYGTVSMRLSPGEAQKKSNLLAHGNPVRLEFANGLPAWGGVMDLPREHTRDATRLSLYSAEYILGWTVAEEWASYIGDGNWDPDEIMTSMLIRSDAADRYHINLEGGVWGQSPGKVVVDGRGDDLLTIAGSVRQKSPDFHWYIQAVTVWPPTTSLRFQLHQFYDYRRDRRMEVNLIEGHNFVNVEVVEQGPIYNHITVTAGNYDPDDPQRRLFIAYYGEPIGNRRRERFITMPEVIGSGLANEVVPILRERAEAEYQRYSQPRVRFRGYAINMPPARFGTYEIGDVVNVTLNRYAATGGVIPFLIIGMEFDPAQGLLTLVGEEIAEEKMRR